MQGANRSRVLTSQSPEAARINTIKVTGARGGREGLMVLSWFLQSPTWEYRNKVWVQKTP